MKYLLDTHTLIWTFLDSSRISKKSLSAIQDVDNQIYISALSFWEISLKFSLKKLQLKGFEPNNLPDLCLKSGFQIIPLDAQEASEYYLLPKKDNHRDPFNRMLIRQAIIQNMILITADKAFDQYLQYGLRIDW